MKDFLEDITGGISEEIREELYKEFDGEIFVNGILHEYFKEFLEKSLKEWKSSHLAYKGCDVKIRFFTFKSAI